MIDANLNLDQPKGTGEVEQRRTRSSHPAGEPSDLELVAAYRAASERYGQTSQEASLTFEPIFKRYWNYVQTLSASRMGVVCAEDLSSETMFTVLERLNGHEVITNLRGLVRHSFEREYATLLEKLFQGRKLMRAGLITVEPQQDQAKARIKGATVVSLNQPSAHSDSEDLDLMHLLSDPKADVVEAASRLELVRTLHKLIKEMPSQYSEPLVYQWLMGKRIKEVAEELDLTIDQVKHNTARGIKWLSKRMPGTSRDWLD